MKSRFLHIAALLLLPVVLLSSISWTQSRHLCLVTGKVMEADCCSPEMTVDAPNCADFCQEGMTSSVDKRPCCVNQVQTFESQVEVFLKSAKWKLEQWVALDLSNYGDGSLTSVSKAVLIPHKLAIPPPKSYTSLLIFIACFRC